MSSLNEDISFYDITITTVNIEKLFVDRQVE